MLLKHILHNSFFTKTIIVIMMVCAVYEDGNAQEFNAVFNINRNAIQGTDAAVFEKLKEKLEEFFNNRQWTNLQFKENERIPCTFNITVKKYDASTNMFTCTAMVQANRPVYKSSYTSSYYNNVDNDFNFEFSQFDQIEFNEDMISEQLPALLAYYAYLLIGINLDTFAPLGGEDILKQCMNLANNAQNLNFTGWKSFDNRRNRYAIINDYLDGALEPFRKLQYDYYRKGLDEMSTNVERGRINITTAIEENLKASHENRPLSLLPQIWTDFKKEELANIYKGKGTQKEKETVYDILFSINASQNNTWEKIKQ